VNMRTRFSAPWGIRAHGSWYYLTVPSMSERFDLLLLCSSLGQHAQITAVCVARSLAAHPSGDQRRSLASKSAYLTASRQVWNA
jgi:hypothetical protein